MNKNEFRDALAMFAYGRKPKDGECVQCESPKVTEEDFKDAVSLKEFQISRLCQVCQDDFFGKESDESFDDS